MRREPGGRSPDLGQVEPISRLHHLNANSGHEQGFFSGVVAAAAVVAAPHYITLSLSPAGKLQWLCDGNGCRVGRKIKAADRWTVTGFSLIIWRICLVTPHPQEKKTTHTQKRMRWQFVLLLKLEEFFFCLFFLRFTCSHTPAHSELSALLRIKGSGRRGHRFFALRPYLLLCSFPSGREL